ncbi:MAG: deoxyribose-phosphate aldolase [Candidatus Nealsonbacteria bacterium DGGOD1a]|jgi:deoxyribose-phosphate aldolase|nr:MAG: deoxyribose-phosphate aldolase [Candidatus Nealsonbacteria bacterium DGGOD1a]
MPSKTKKPQKKVSLASRVDQTNIDPKAGLIDIKKTCAEVKKYGLRGICVNPQWVAAAKDELRDFPAKVICLVDAPIGDSSHEERMQICLTAKNNGADELDVVASLPDIKHERWEEVYKDLAAICEILPTKVIIGSGYLTDKEIAMVSRLVKQAGAICVKTATSKDPLEERELKEKAWHLEIMKKNAPGLLIKASGNIKNAKEAKAYVRAGADIIGTSSGPKIAKGE